MNIYDIKPRIENITSFITKDEIKSLKPEDNIELPERVLGFVGNVNKVSYPQQGMCSLVSIIDGSNGKYILKTAKGEYRGKELCAEYEAMKQLKTTDMPVPLVYDFFQLENLYCLLREYSLGTPLNVLFNDNEDKNERLYMIEEMAKLLKKIHNINVDVLSFDDYISSHLYFAEHHLNNNTIDINDFVFQGKTIDPKNLLSWAKESHPKSGKTCLIHGDYRPKNMLWNNNKISCILDWAFCDIGDPYYDLAMINDYFIDDIEQKTFFEAYGLEDIDKERLDYYTKMVGFINI